MNSIVFPHVFAPDGATSLDAALDRLGAWSDAEIGSLARLMRVMGCAEAAADIAALRGLHLDPDATPEEVRQLLSDATAPLERLLERVRAVPTDGETVGQAPPDFEAWVRWSGARLEDILSTLRRTLSD